MKVICFDSDYIYIFNLNLSFISESVVLQPGSTVVPLKGRPHMVLYELNEFIKEYREQTNITETKDRAAGQGVRSHLIRAAL